MALLVGGCGSRARDEAGWIDTLTDEILQGTDGAVSEDQARCAASEIVDRIGVENLQGVLDANPGRSTDGARVVAAAFDHCDIFDALTAP